MQKFSVRQRISRLVRESLSFSKKMENHVRNRDMRSNSFMIVPLSLLAWMVISQPVKAERVC
ncbi:MAG: hypothetical protein ACKN9A_03380, partial [Microcystis aeruginosa]